MQSPGLLEDRTDQRRGNVVANEEEEPRLLEGPAHLGAEALRSRVEAFGPGGALSRPGGAVITHGFNAAQGRHRGRDDG